MQITVYCSETCTLYPRIQATAKMCNVSVSRADVKDMDTEGLCFRKYPAAATQHGLIVGSKAILRYLANAHPAEELYGRTLGERAAVDAILDAISSDMDVPMMAAGKGSDSKKAAEEIMAVAEAMNKTLAHSTYLVGERMTIADVAAASNLREVISKKVVDISSLIHLVRMVNTVAGRAGCPEKIVANVAEKKIEAAPEKKKAEKKVEEKKIEAAETIDIAPIKRERPEQDAMADGTFNMDAWKTVYSNTKDYRGEAMDGYFYKNFDNEHWTVWKVEYLRYSNENTKPYQASNLTGMFLQRIENALRKHMFGVFNIFDDLETKGCYSVEGVMIIKGKTMPKYMVENDQYESFSWTPMEYNEESKKIVGDWFCEFEKIGDRTIADCKVYK